MKVFICDYRKGRPEGAKLGDEGWFDNEMDLIPSLLFDAMARTNARGVDGAMDEAAEETANEWNEDEGWDKYKSVGHDIFRITDNVCVAKIMKIEQGRI